MDSCNTAKPWVTPGELAEMLGVGVKSVRSWPRRRENPMPVHYPPGNRCEWRVFMPEFNEWAMSTWDRR